MWLNGVLLTVLVISVVTDIKERKIYNKVLFPALLAAFAIQTVEGGLYGTLTAVSGLAVGMAILLIPYLMGGMGAGDVKLLGLVGACKGVGFVLAASVYMALAGVVLSLIVLLCRKGALHRLKWTAIVFCSFHFGIRLPLFADRKAAWSSTAPYGVAISAGAAINLWWRGWLL
jgi:prepilin peptidase CpaA